MRALQEICTASQSSIYSCRETAWKSQDSLSPGSRELSKLRKAAPAGCIDEESLPSAGRLSALTDESDELLGADRDETKARQQAQETAFGLEDRAGRVSSQRRKYQSSQVRYGKTHCTVFTCCCSS